MTREPDRSTYQDPLTVLNQLGQTLTAASIRPQGQTSSTSLPSPGVDHATHLTPIGTAELSSDPVLASAKRFEVLAVRWTVVTTCRVHECHPKVGVMNRPTTPQNKTPDGCDRKRFSEFTSVHRGYQLSV